MDISRLEGLLERKKNCKLMIHNGFFAWSYGSPQDPIVISLSTAIKVLSLFEMRTGKDANEEMENNTLGLIYAEKDDDLFFMTDKNRIIGLYDLEECVFTMDYDKGKEHDFEIY